MYVADQWHHRLRLKALRRVSLMPLGSSKSNLPSTSADICAYRLLNLDMQCLPILLT